MYPVSTPYVPRMYPAQDDPLLRAERALAEQPALKDGAPSMATAPSTDFGAALDIFVGEGDLEFAPNTPESSLAGPWWRRIGSRFAPA